MGGEDASEAGGDEDVEEEDAAAAETAADDSDLFAFVKRRDASGLGQGSF